MTSWNRCKRRLNGTISLKRDLTAARFNALVSAVRTVFVSVTLPVLRDTHVGSRTLEGFLAAGFGLCQRELSSPNIKIFSTFDSL